MIVIQGAYPNTASLMFRAIQLVFAPALAWGKIVRANRGVLTVVVLTLLPLLLLTAAAEGWSMNRVGIHRGPFSPLVPLDQDKVLVYEGFQVLLSLALVFFASFLVKWICEGFHFNVSLQRCFTLAAFGLSPVFLARFLNAAPSINPWVGWAVGVCLTIYVLYQGVAIVLEPEQTKGFGIYIMTSMVCLAMSGLCQFLLISYLSKHI